MCKRLQGRGGADTRPLSPTSVPTVSQAPCWVLYKYGPHDNLLGRWGYPILQMGILRLSGQMNHPCIMWLKFEAVGGTRNSGKGFQELGCWRDGESQAPGLRGHLPSCTVCGNEILRDPGHLWLLSAASPASQGKLSNCFPVRPTSSWCSNLTSSSLPREPQWVGRGVCGTPGAIGGLECFLLWECWKGSTRWGRPGLGWGI